LDALTDDNAFRMSNYSIVMHISEPSAGYQKVVSEKNSFKRWFFKTLG